MFTVPCSYVKRRLAIPRRLSIPDVRIGRHKQLKKTATVSIMTYLSVLMKHESSVYLTIAHASFQKHSPQGSESNKVILFRSQIRYVLMLIGTCYMTRFAHSHLLEGKIKTKSAIISCRQIEFSVFFNIVCKHRLLQGNRRQDKNLISVLIKERTYGTQEYFWLDLGQENLI